MHLFTPRPGGLAAVSATTTTGRVRLAAQPSASSFQVRVYNEGSTVAFVEFGGSDVDATTTGSLPVPPGIPCGFTVPNPQRDGDRYMAAIMASGTGRISVSVGDGI